MAEDKQEYRTNAQAQRTASAIAAVLLVIGLAIAYFVWPTGITDLPLGAITLGAALQALAAAFIGLVTVSFVVGVWLDV